MSQPLQPVDQTAPVVKPVIQRPSSWAAAGTFLTLLVGALNQGLPLFPKSWDPYLPQIATGLGILAAWLKSREVDAKAGVMAQTVADHLDENVSTEDAQVVSTLRAVADAAPATGLKKAP